MPNLQTLRLSTALLLTAAALAQPPRPREHFPRATVQYDWVKNHRGEKLRTFITRPNNLAGKAPVLFFVGWLSCDSVEYPDANTSDGYGILLRRLIDESGYATLRMDKPGIGESEGDCGKADFKSEMEGYQAAFDSLSKYDFLDLDRVYVVGLSNGGGFSPLAAGAHPVRGFISCGAWGRTWYEHMLDVERRQITQQGMPPAQVTNAVKAYIDFYNLYLTKGLTPGRIIAQHPEWKDLWHDSPDGQYGRPAAFYQQLEALNLGEVWQNVTAPVLVVRGTGDTIMSRPDSEAIVRAVYQVHPGNVTYLELDNMTHDFTVAGKFDEELIPALLNWLKTQSRSAQP